MDAQEQLFDLMAAAEEQQKTAKPALNGAAQALAAVIGVAKDATPAHKTGLEDAASAVVVEPSIGWWPCR